MKPLAAILATLCLAAGWYYASCITSTYGVGVKRGAPNDYFQLWNASRAVLDGEDPYSRAVSERYQLFLFGAPSKALGIPNTLPLAYPVQGMYPLLALGLLPFGVADKIALCLFSSLIALSVGWMRQQWDGRTYLYILLAFSTYPIIVAMQMRQPTLFFFGLSVASFALLRSGRLSSAAILMAFAVGKPQVVLPILLPMLLWTFARWSERKRFAIIFAVAVVVIGGISMVAFPGWVPEWLSSLREYSRYVHPSIIISTLGPRIGALVSMGLLIGLTAVLWLERDRDLLFQAAVSVVVFCFLIQAETYNLVLLLVPAVWVADNASRLSSRGDLAQLTLALVRVAFIESWIASAVGALLLQTTQTGRSIGVHLGIDTAFPILGSLTAVMLWQLMPAQNRDRSIPETDAVAVLPRGPLAGC